MNFLLDLPWWLLACYLIPLLINLCWAILDVHSDGYLQVGRLALLLAFVFIPVWNIGGLVVTIIVALEGLGQRIIWRRAPKITAPDGSKLAASRAQDDWQSDPHNPANY